MSDEEPEDAAEVEPAAEAEVEGEQDEDDASDEPEGRQVIRLSDLLMDDEELTDEEREKLHKTTEGLSKYIGSQVKFNLPRIPVLPDSYFKNIASISGIFDKQHLAITQALKPLLDSQVKRHKQFNVINSDILKAAAFPSANLGNIAAQLTRNMDFGAGESMAKFAKQFAAQQSSWLAGITPALKGLKTAFYPENLRGIEDLDFTDVESVVMVDGIALYGVPRTSIAKSLILADGAAKRREILGRKWKPISADCRQVALACNHKGVARYVPFILEALDALDAGHIRSAQALVGSLADAMVTDVFQERRHDYRPSLSGKRTKAAFDKLTVRRFIAFAPMWQVFQKFEVSNGDKVPTTFSRNATAHTVSARQFNRRNAVQGLMFVTSLLYFLEEQLNAGALKFTP